jgi:hypothetical protein
VFDSSVHLAPNAPWIVLLVLTLGVLLLGAWAYRFAIPPLPALARRALPALRVLALAALLWLLAQPVLERSSGGSSRLVVLLDRSRSMDLPARSGGPPRARVAEQAVEGLRRGLQGRASVEVMTFASHLATDSARGGATSSTALGEALAELAQAPEAQRASGVVVVSDGAVNAGQDPVAAGRALGLPVHAVVVGSPGLADRAVEGLETSTRAQVGRPTPVRVRITSTEERGVPIGVRMLDGGQELGRATVVSPGPGLETTAEFRVTPLRPGLALWTARADSLRGEASGLNNARQAAVEVAPGRTRVLFISGGLNWDGAFLRRSLAGDSSLRLTSWTHQRGSWLALEREGRGSVPTPADLRGAAVVILDGLNGTDVSPAFDRALTDFVRNGGAVLALGGSSPGVMRFRAGVFGRELGLSITNNAASSAAPAPAPEAREILAWDDDPARGERAWRSAAPLGELIGVETGAGDRVLIRSAGAGPPLAFARRIGRGQVLLVNGSGLWRWSLSGHDDLTAERGRRLWRNLARWLAEPVQGEPLRIRPERWLTAGGEPVRLFATLQDSEFRPVGGARVEGEVRDPRGRARRVVFEPRAAGSYVATLDGLDPGRYQVAASATRGGTSLGRAASEFGVDRWNLEEARTLPDSATLVSLATATGGRVTGAEQAQSWARGLETRALARGRTDSLRLWESPWVFGVIVGALSVEWIWRRRRGLP